MRKVTLLAIAAAFLGAQAAIAAPLPASSGEQLRGTDSSLVVVKHRKKHKKSKMTGDDKMQGGGMQGGQGGAMQGGQGGAMQGGGMSGGAGGQGGMQGGTSR
jgi:hypothetical protein